jgi:cytochrome c oxidase subunit 2
MNQGFTLFPEQASTAAERVDTLLAVLLGTSLLVSLLIAVLIVYFCVKYRRRPGNMRTPRITGSIGLELFWTIIPMLIFLGFFVWGADVFFYIAHPPRDAIEVYVVAKQWMWKIQHAEGQREINELHVPLGQPVRLTLISEDVIHGFFVPAFRTKIDVLPERYTQTWFQATKVGRYHLFCSQYCGTNHSGMTGEVIVMRPEDYQAWLADHAEGSMALEGRKVLLKYQCTSCHSADAVARCPVLEGLYGQRVVLRDGSTVIADDAYLRESVLYPDAKIVAGFEPIMPSFKGQIGEEELIHLTAFLKNLERNGTPPRVDRAPPPAVPVPASEPTSKPVPASEPAAPATPSGPAAANERESSR